MQRCCYRWAGIGGAATSGDIVRRGADQQELVGADTARDHRRGLQLADADRRSRSLRRWIGASVVECSSPPRPPVWVAEAATMAAPAGGYAEGRRSSEREYGRELAGLGRVSRRFADRVEHPVGPGTKKLSPSTGQSLRPAWCVRSAGRHSAPPAPGCDDRPSPARVPAAGAAGQSAGASPPRRRSRFRRALDRQLRCKCDTATRSNSIHRSSRRR